MSELNGLNAGIQIPQATNTINLSNTSNTTTPQGNEVEVQRNLLDGDMVKMSNIASSVLAGGIGAGLSTKVPKASFEMEAQSVKEYVFNIHKNINTPYDVQVEKSKNRVSLESQNLTPMTIKNVGVGTLQGAKYGAIIGGVVSSIMNTYNVLTGKTKTPEAVGTVIADTATATISGAGGAFAGGLSAWGLGLAGLGGTPALIVGVGIGALGALGSQLLMNKFGIYDTIKEKISNLF